jgi:hypothetical protein
MLDIDVKNGQNLARHSQIFLPIAIARQAASVETLGANHIILEPWNVSSVLPSSWEYI